jgi:hypothetical protein
MSMASMTMMYLSVAAVNIPTDLNGHEKGGYFPFSAGASIMMIDPLLAAFSCPTATNDHEKEVCFRYDAVNQLRSQLPPWTFHGHEKGICFLLDADASITMGELVQ